MVLMILMQLVGGLSLFLLGIRFLSKGMEKYAGATMQKLIERLTNNSLKGFGVGAVSSALTQSSSMVMVTMIGMINAGLMGLNQGIGIILGFGVGTTITAQLIAFDVGFIFLGVIALGFFLNLFSSKLKYKYLGQALLGLGILFMGMSLMKEAMVPLAAKESLIFLITLFTKWPVLAVLGGFVLTALIQSSSATVGILIAMGAAGAISLPVAIALSLGANVGTCVTGIIASFGGSKGAKQAVAAQILIATTGMLLFLPLISPFANLISLTATNLPRQIANAHTIHNIIISILFLPLTGVVAKLIRHYIPDSPEDTRAKKTDFDPEEDPERALKDIRKEVVRLGLMAKHMLENAEFSILNPERKMMKKILREVLSTEEEVDKLRYKLEKKLSEISGPKVTRLHSGKRLALLHHTVDIERVADLSLNLTQYAKQLADNKKNLSEKDQLNLRRMFTKVRQAYSLSLESIEKDSPAISREVRSIEEEIDDLDITMHKDHLRRLDSGEAKGMSSAIFLESLRDLERIGDHADNIGKSILSPFDGEINLTE